MKASRLAVVLLIAVLAGLSPLAGPALAADGKAAAGPGVGDLAGFVVSPQAGGSNQVLLIAPDGSWFLATSLGASGARMIDTTSGVVLRFLRSPGLSLAGLSISPDGKAALARDYDGHVVAWDSTTGQLMASPPGGDPQDVQHLSLRDDAGDPEGAEFISRHHLQSHFPQLKPSDLIALNPARNYAIVGTTDDSEWKTFQIWNVKDERPEVSFRLASTGCGYPPFAFDYDGKHVVFGNTGGECDSNHLDFAVFRIDRSDGIAQATEIVAPKCTVPAGVDPGFTQDFTLSASGHFITRGGGMPGSPEWTAWDLRTGDKVTTIHPDGVGTISADDSTMVIIHDLLTDGPRPQQSMTVRRDGQERTFELPASIQSGDWRPLLLSTNGRWIASKVADTVAVWSTETGKLLREDKVGKRGDILRLSDTGDPLLVNDSDGTVFAHGAWQRARSEDGGPLVALTPDFHAQCGPVFCDRVIAELGVVERKPVDPRVRRHDVRRDLSPDGRFLIVRPDHGRGIDIVDVADGHVTAHLDQTAPQFTPDSRFILMRDVDAGGFAKFELATGKRIWTVFPNHGQDGFSMILADGRVRYSPTQKPDFQLVRGFEIRPFDAAARKQFVAPPER